MNIFIIPSWSPSEESPFAGIFFKEQVEALAFFYPESNFALSTWGSHDDDLLLWAKDHLFNLQKIFKYFLKSSSIKRSKPNLIVYHSPSLTWNRKFLKGNLSNIIRVNEKHFLQFKSEVSKVDLIHAHVAFPAGYIAMKIAEKYGIPFIITEHMGPFPLPSFMVKGRILPQLTEPLQKAKTVICVSPFAANDFRKKTGIQPLIIPNLVNEYLFTPPQRTTIPTQFIFFTLSGMDQQKGIPDLLKGISLMKDSGSQFRIGGEGNEKKKYQELARKLNISHRISWPGELSRTEAAKEFQSCHAFVLPSIHESMGVVYAEAIACGKPIIATRCGGPEFIVTENNGILVDVNAPQQLADAMDKMIKDYNSYKPEIIRQDFMERFSSNAVTKKIQKVYNAVASNKPLPSELFLID